MPKLLKEVRDRIRARRHSVRTEEAYLRWNKDFILFHDKHHTKEMGAGEVRDCLTHLAVSRNVASSTQNQALSAIGIEPMNKGSVV